MVLSFVDSTIRPRLKAKAVLLIVTPLAHILGSVGVSVSAATICLVVNPFSLIDVAVSVVQLTAAVRFAVLPLSLVATAIEPFLFSLAVANAIVPLSLIDSTAVEVDRAADFSNVFFEIGRLLIGGGAVQTELRLIVVVVTGVVQV